jgi:hypothetical protein
MGFSSGESTVMADAVSIAVMAAVLGALLLTASLLIRRADDRRVYAATVAALRWWMLPLAVVHVAIVGAVILLLMNVLPLLRFGWWHLFGGIGNIALGQTSHPGLLWRIVALGLPSVLMVLVPVLAYREEQIFRHGSETRTRAACARAQMVFGLAHSLVAGVPLAAGVALILSGCLYQVVYTTALNRARNGSTPDAAQPLSPGRASPSLPSGPYEAVEWDEHRRLRHEVSQHNRRLVVAWASRESERIRAETTVMTAARSEATACAAATHAVTNWFLLVMLVGSLLTSFA